MTNRQISYVIFYVFVPTCTKTDLKVALMRIICDIFLLLNGFYNDIEVTMDWFKKYLYRVSFLLWYVNLYFVYRFGYSKFSVIEDSQQEKYENQCIITKKRSDLFWTHPWWSIFCTILSFLLTQPMCKLVSWYIKYIAHKNYLLKTLLSNKI